jgi:hypothetical protein
VGRKSREKRQRRETDIQSEREDPGNQATPDGARATRIGDLQDRLKREVDEDAVFWTSGNCPAEVRETDLEDILAFESTGAGVSLFEGLQAHGVILPRPEELDEQQSAAKIAEVLHELLRLRILLVGFEDMTALEFYSTLWNETLWEGCYVEKRNPGAMTLIDVSHRLSRADFMRLMEDLHKTGRVH